MLLHYPVEAAVPVLIEAPKNEDDNVREWASVDLANLGPAALPALSALIETDPEANDHIRENVELAVSRIGELAVPALIDGLLHKKAYVRAASARGLSAIGRRSATAAPALSKALKDPEGKGRVQILD